VPVTRRLINQTYARLWGAAVVSSTGDWMGIAAVAVLVVRLGGDLGGATGAAVAVTVTMGVRLAALLIVGPVVARVVDRADPRALLVGLDVLRAALVALLPLLVLPGVLVVAAVLEAVAALWTPTRDSALPTFVPRDQLPRANAASVVASFGTMPLGAALFTLVAAAVAWLGVDVPAETPALWLDAASFAVSAVIVSRLGLGPSPRRQRVLLAEGAADVPEAASVSGVLRDPVLRSRIIAISVAFVAVGALTGLGPVLVRYDLGAGAAAFGLLVTALGIGGLLGLVLVVRGAGAVPASPERLEVVVPPGLVVAAVAVAVLALTNALWAAVVATFVAGVAAGAVWVAAYTQFQREPVDRRPAVLAAVTVVARSCLLTSRMLFPALAVPLGAWAASGASVPSGSRLALLSAAAVLLLAARLARPRPPGEPRRAR
jgi:dTMP kinase